MRTVVAHRKWYMAMGGRWHHSRLQTTEHSRLNTSEWRMRPITQLPPHEHTFKPATTDQHNRSAHELAALKIGTMVDVQDNRSGRWATTGTVVAIGQNRDYFVKLPSGRVYWRNRRFLHIHYPATPVAVSLMPHQREDAHQKRPRDEGHEKQNRPSTAQVNPSLRRSDRTRKPVARFGIASFREQSYD
eukprot:scpid94648/ scgid10640/ 